MSAARNLSDNYSVAVMGLDALLSEESHSAVQRKTVNNNFKVNLIKTFLINLASMTLRLLHAHAS